VYFHYQGRHIYLVSSDKKIAKTDDKNCPVYMPDINDVVFTGLDGKANDAINYSVVKGSDSERDHKKKILHFMPPVPV